MDEITITDIFNEFNLTQSMDKSIIRKLLLSLPLDEKGELIITLDMLLLHKYKFETIIQDLLANMLESLNKPVVKVICRGYDYNASHTV